MQKSTNIETLNKILQGEYMAIEAYEKFLQDIDDTDLKHQLTCVLDEHKNHAYILAMRVKELGEQPQQGAGMPGVLANAMLSAKTLISADNFDILKELYEGENKGIQSVLQMAEEGLSDYDKQLVEEMMTEDYTHLKTLSSLMNNQQPKVLH